MNVALRDKLRAIATVFTKGDDGVLDDREVDSLVSLGRIDDKPEMLLPEVRDELLRMLKSPLTTFKTLAVRERLENILRRAGVTDDELGKRTFRSRFDRDSADFR
jgi:hypothetical protein